MRGPIERLGELIAAWGRRSDRALHEQLDAVEAVVNALDMEQARQRAAEAVENPEWYDVTARVVQPNEAPLLDILPPTTREFLGRYPQIRARHSDLHMALSLTEPSTRFPELIKIGDDTEFTDVLAAPDGRILLVGPDEHPTGAASYRTIYHWILVHTATVHPDFAEQLI